MSNIQNKDKILNGKLYLGTCWGGGISNGIIRLVENKSSLGLLICRRKNVLSGRIIFSDQISSAKMIKGKTKIPFEDNIVGVKKYVLTLTDGTVFVCSVIKGEQSDAFEAVAFSSIQ